MDASSTIDPIQRSFCEALSELYGSALDRVVLFGSRARGEAGPESDYDVAVFLKEVGPGMAEWNRLADLRLRFLDAGGPSSTPSHSSHPNTIAIARSCTRSDATALPCEAPDRPVFGDGPRYAGPRRTHADDGFDRRLGLA